MNSGQGLAVRAGWTTYASSKYALRALADGLRGEEAEHGIRVTSVFPGRTASSMQQAVRDFEGTLESLARVVFPALFGLVMAYFGVSSFLRARKISRS